ncbi:bifunctional riboflavin kinase/FAD synthetase [Rothia sp. ZJ1223]|uniref:bifunctional riboflavin kinase/FAD synthetase n=1 Tax=Rothia sp. ZJ1223 TaxID=2811098 RepID=UPI00195704C8|nr:bifunctional riboflavin kinase/FAD synthetase [Rothia sp. ZJ1223]
MERYTDLQQVPADFGPSVVTLGNFDGAHSGHAKVIERVVDVARARGLTSVAVSFDPHPAVVHNPGAYHPEIMGQEDRQRLLQQMGLEHYVLIHYTLEFSAQSAEEFVKSTFVDALKAKAVVVGDDVRFGYRNSGDLSTMIELGEKYGFEVFTVDDLTHDSARRCSSTWIRELLAEGQVEDAAEILGRPHLMRGEVVHGLARGRELGFPTANLSVDSDGFVPADGVYAGWLTDEAGNRWPVATSVGTNPTFEGVERRQVEAHVMGRPQERVEDFDLYDQRVVLEFTARLRPMVAYTGVEALIEQMNKDVQDAQQVLGLAL